MVHNDNAEWEEFSALLDDVVPDTSESIQDTRSDAYHASQTYAQAQEELQSACTYEDDNDLEEVDVDTLALESQAEMETGSGATAQNQDPTHKVLATGPVVAEAPVELSSGSSSTATTRSAEPQSEAAANRARATERGYLARRRAMRKSASVQTAKDGTSTKKKAVSKQASSRTRSAPSQEQHIAAARIPDAATVLPSSPLVAAATHPIPQALPRPQTGTQQATAPAPTSVPTPSSSSSTSIARPAPSSSRAAPSPATLPPPPPLPVGPAGRRQLWEEDLKLGLPHLKAGYRIALPPARPASAPVVGAASAGPVPQVGSRHQSAPVASTSRGKRSRDVEDRGDDVVQKRPKVNNAQGRKRVQASAQSPSGGTHRPQWIPYAAPQAEPSTVHGPRQVAQPNAAQDQQQNTRHQPAKQVPQLPQPRRAGPSTETSRETNGTSLYRAGRGGSAAYTVPQAPPSTLQRPVQVTPGAGPWHHSGERASEQTYTTPVLPSSSYDSSSIPRTFARAVLSATSGGTRNHALPEVHGNATVSEHRQPIMPEAGPSRSAYEQLYEDTGLQSAYNQPASAQAYTMPVPSGWNDPAAVPRTFARAQSSTRQTESQSLYLRAQEVPVAYAAQPQQQTGRPVPPVYGGGGMLRGAEQLPNVDAALFGNQPVYNQPYAPPMPMPAGWSSNVGGERVPNYLTMYAPPNHPPPGWNPQGQAPVYEQEPSAQSFSRGQSAYAYGYDF